MPVGRVAVLAAAAMVTALTPMAALAHADLVSSTPEADAVLPAPPDEVVLVFGGELNPDGTEFVVTGGGAVVGEGVLDLNVADRDEVRGTVAIDDPGTYTVAWTSVAVDGHAETGEFSFTVAGDAAQPDTAARLEDRHVPSTAIGWILLLLAIAIGMRRATRAIT